MPSRMTARAIWIPAALLCVGQGFIYYKKPPALFAPSKELKAFANRDKTLSLKGPANWKGTTTSSQGIQTEIRFAPSMTAQFVISHDLMGSLMADIARSGSNMLEGMPGMQSQANMTRKTPLQAVHALQVKEMEMEYEGVKDGKETPVQLAGFEALRSDFTCEEGELVGQRYSALTGEGRLSLIFVCSKGETKYMMPTFEKMAQSLKVGGSGKGGQ